MMNFYDVIDGDVMIYLAIIHWIWVGDALFDAQKLSMHLLMSILNANKIE